MIDKLKQMHKGTAIGIVAGIIILGIIIFLVLCELASRQAADIFNREMAKQQVLLGQVKAEKLSADLWGNVYFTKLSWMAPNGAALINVEQGRMKVSAWDIVVNKPSLESIEELELDNALIHVGFDNNMHMDVLHRDKQPGVKKEHKLGRKNLNLPDNLPNIKLIFKDTVLSAEYKKRSFILNDVNGFVQVKHHKDLVVHLDAGKFGGSMVGDGLNIDGTVHLDASQKLLVNLGLYKVVPASLGLSNANDPMTITGEMKGTLQEPTIDGSVAMDELNLPGLNFTKINGNYHYANGLISLDNVTGSIYGGTVEAYGVYHFDNHHYKIDAHGKDLMASAAARTNAINCSVELDIKFRNNGKNAGSLTYGTFKSGRGNYLLVPFKSISGSFSDQNKELGFTNVIIATDLGNVESNAFKFVNGRVQLSDIFFVEANGQRTRIR